MQIGIIGAGNVGSTLARHFVRLGYRVQIANSRGPSSLAAVVQETGARAVTAAEAARAADLIILSIPLSKVNELPLDLFVHTPQHTALVDTGNYYPGLRDDPIPEIDAGVLESEWVAKTLRRSVIKAFNNIGVLSLQDRGRPAGVPGRIALPVAGDHFAAKHFVMQLVGEIGFDAVDIGPLTESWRQQPGTPAYCHDLDAVSLRAALAEAKHEQIARYRHEANERAKSILGTSS
ncbi:MAG TPA: NAD(P)-binding domain-containing protein [Polyangiales bacterium]|nr:NAD(P)-binding domain-containing protein [Polyangiales bacterium]